MCEPIRVAYEPGFLRILAFWSPATTPSSRCHGFVTAWAAISASNMGMHWCWHSYCYHGQNRLSDRVTQTVNRNSRLTKLQHAAQQQPERKNCLPTCTTINAHIMVTCRCLPSGLVLPAPMHLPLGVATTQQTLHTTNSSFAQSGQASRKTSAANTIHLLSPAHNRETRRGTVPGCGETHKCGQLCGSELYNTSMSTKHKQDI
jgi:hypothetical protein